MDHWSHQRTTRISIDSQNVKKKKQLPDFCYIVNRHRKCSPLVLNVMTSPWPRSDVTLMETSQDEGSSCWDNSDSISHSIISRCRLVIFVHINCILTKLSGWKLRVRVMLGSCEDLVCERNKLPPKTSACHPYRLRKRQHPYQLPTIQFSQHKNSFINRCLFKIV